MTNVLIRDVPESTHAKLRERASASGCSLQSYLRMELERMASTPTMEEVLADIERHSGGRVGFQEAMEAIHEERVSR